MATPEGREILLQAVEEALRPAIDRHPGRIDNQTRLDPWFTVEQFHLLEEAVKALDKAATKGAIHPKAASRTISRLSAQVHKLAGTTKAAPPKAAFLRCRTSTKTRQSPCCMMRSSSPPSRNWH